MKSSTLRACIAPLLGAALTMGLFNNRAAGQPAGYFVQPRGYHHASTLEEGYARGLADVVRSAGAANLMHSRAALNYEDARAKYFENRLRGVQTYFDMKQMNRDYRAEMRGQRATSEQLFRLAKARAPEPLSPSELDPYSGEVRWPMLLLDDHYTENREMVDDLVRKRVSDPLTVTTDDRAALRASLDGLAQQMQANISVYNPQEYVNAKSFLQSLAVTTNSGAIY